MWQKTSLHSLPMTHTDKLKAAVLQKYGRDGLSVLEQYNPECIFRRQMTADECFLGEYPTLGQLRAQYDSRFPCAWLMAHLYDLSEYCGCKDKLEGRALQQCASVIAVEFYYLKVSEMMLFFHRFKAGRYGQFYGSIDPLVIVKSLYVFLQNRRYVLDYYEQKRKDRERIESQKRAVSYDTYRKMCKTRIEEHSRSEEG